MSEVPLTPDSTRDNPNPSQPGQPQPLEPVPQVAYYKVKSNPLSLLDGPAWASFFSDIGKPLTLNPQTSTLNLQP
jgi:hypothetical protein